MRGDMPKVIVERPRHGGSKLRKGRSLRDDDLALSKVGMKRHARMRGGWKGLNENLNPLRRFLEGQVGRPWNKVWSEICENLKPSNTVQQHVRDHIPDFVAIKTSLREGEIWVHDRWGLRPLKESRVKLFVDPKSGLLRRNKRRVSRKAPPLTKVKCAMRVVSDTKQLHLLDDGAWWEVTLAKVPTGTQVVPTCRGPRRVSVALPVDDVVLRTGLTKLSPGALYGRPDVFAVAKRQLSKKEIRDQDLRA